MKVQLPDGRTGRVVTKVAGYALVRVDGEERPAPLDLDNWHKTETLTEAPRVRRRRVLRL